MDNGRVSSVARALVVAACLLSLSACDLPPMDSEQKGWRGIGMVEIDNPEDVADDARKNVVPDLGLAIIPPSDGPKAGDIYENVQVLNDISVGEFVGLMTAITAWVSPEEGCTYCHNDAFSDDGKYTKIVARRMLQMTQAINSNWGDHVGGAGVNCYTCHRGNPVPEYIWFEGGELPDTEGMIASRLGQNLASESVGSSSLPYDTFSALIESPDGEAMVQSAAGLPSGQIGDMRQTEKTYALMMHMSQALGVNCTHCHNSRAFRDWNQSTPARVTAWHGIRMARELNNEYLAPLQPVYPAMRLGPSGDAPKANCTTCHQGLAKPLYGENMVNDYPALTAYQDKISDTQTADPTSAIATAAD